jgi:omega-6 fatty acid desaturase (delta-12 desaturase)
MSTTPRIPDDLTYIVKSCGNDNGNDNNVLNHLVSSQMTQTELYYKYKSSVRKGLWYFAKHMFFTYYLLRILIVFKQTYFGYCMIPILGLMLGKTFIIFHDCQHNSYTPFHDLNYVLSLIAGTFVTTSPNWILDHNTHHLTNGNIENKYNFVFNETVIFTVNQYNKLSTWGKKMYEIYKNPFVFFGILPIVYFGILHRFFYIVKKLMYKHKIKNELSVILFNHSINNVAVCILFYYLYNHGILYHYLAALWVFYVHSFIVFHNQHTYNPPFVVGNDTWTMQDSGLKGSSFIQIPWILKYIYGGIEYHHIHHMNPKIPGYNLENYHNDVVNTSHLFDNVVKLSLTDCYHNMSLVLYCEKRNKYITFDELDEE